MARSLARISAVVGWVGLVGLGAAGCSSPAAATPPITNDPFSGVVNPLGSDTHNFTVNYTGGSSDASVNVGSLVTVANSTPVSITVGIGLGVVSLGVCNLFILNPTAPLNTDLPTTGEPFTAGTYCVEIYDNPSAPTIPAPLKYSLVVTHY